jgi:hypothetical protein
LSPEQSANEKAGDEAQVVEHLEALGLIPGTAKKEKTILCVSSLLMCLLDPKLTASTVAAAIACINRFIYIICKTNYIYIMLYFESVLSGEL